METASTKASVQATPPPQWGVPPIGPAYSYLVDQVKVGADGVSRWVVAAKEKREKRRGAVGQGTGAISYKLVPDGVFWQHLSGPPPRAPLPAPSPTSKLLAPSTPSTKRSQQRPPAPSPPTPARGPTVASKRRLTESFKCRKRAPPEKGPVAARALYKTLPFDSSCSAPLPATGGSTPGPCRICKQRDCRKRPRCVEMGGIEAAAEENAPKEMADDSDLAFRAELCETRKKRLRLTIAIPRDIQCEACTGSGAGEQMIRCEGGCGGWVHHGCAGMRDPAAAAIERVCRRAFVCPPCAQLPPLPPYKPKSIQPPHAPPTPSTPRTASAASSRIGGDKAARRSSYSSSPPPEGTPSERPVAAEIDRELLQALYDDRLMEVS